MKVVRPRVAPPSKGERTVIQVLECIPGVKKVVQEKPYSTKDLSGRDITIRTDSDFFPNGDRVVFLQIKGACKDTARRFKKNHQKCKIAVLGIGEYTVQKHSYFLALVVFVLERPVPRICDQSKMAYLTVFKYKLGILEQYKTNGCLTEYEYIGHDTFRVFLEVGQFHEEFELKWDIPNFTEILKSALANAREKLLEKMQMPQV